MEFKDSKLGLASTVEVFGGRLAGMSVVTKVGTLWIGSERDLRMDGFRAGVCASELI